jgi:hypothetical protein
VVVEAEVKEQGRPLLGVNGIVCSKKDLTEPTLLEMPGLVAKPEKFPPHQNDLGGFGV